MYALQEGQGDPALTADQAAARTALADLVDRLTGVQGDGESYEPSAVAALAGSYVADPDLARDPVTWPGAPSPGSRWPPASGAR
ncbi:hypothetical protein ACFQX8_12530 [Klenkia terrae]|uniref:hypothetical protein n=1 Tax=Klenkia terrae TaxID=1052259 RepID=UPI00361F96DE